LIYVFILEGGAGSSVIVNSTNYFGISILNKDNKFSKNSLFISSPDLYYGTGDSFQINSWQAA
jgi:hypothetical protein